MSPSAEAEKAVGIDWYVTDLPPCSARAKASPEDFLVEEQISVPELTKEPRPDFFPLYRIEKKSIDTFHMARDLAQALRSRVSYAGLKDKRAVAVQYATPTSRRSSRPATIVRERFSASIVGYVPRPLSRSCIVGNGFLVVLRHCCPEVEEAVAQTMREAKRGRIPNFYGLQRFGASGAGTHRVGRALVRAEFKEAVRLLLVHEGSSEAGRQREMQDAFEGGEYGRLLSLLSGGKDVERTVAQELVRHPGEWVKALRAIPVKLRRLYVQAYQSFIFNKTMSLAIERGEDIADMAAGDNWAEAAADGLVVSAVRGVNDTPTGHAVPMVQMAGYAFRDYGSRFDACAKRVLEDEGVRPSQFYLEEMQEVSQEGGFRRPHLVVRGDSWKVEGDAATLRFTLPRGQYATVLLREIVKPSDPGEAGLA